LERSRVSKLWRCCGTIATLLLGVSIAVSAASADTFDRFVELQQQMTARKFVDAEQTASQILKDDPSSPLAGRVLSARAQSRLEQGHLSEAIGDYLEAIKQAETDQRRATVFLELAAAMSRLQLGDHACAAIRRAIDAAGAEDTPMGQLAVARSRANGCPAFADKDFARLFQLPFQMRASTHGTALDSILGGAIAIRFPSDWQIDEASRATPDGVNLSSNSQDAVCAIRRAEGVVPIKAYLDAVSNEDYTRGRRPGGVLLGVNGREGRMGSARAVEVDFGIGPLPGRLYVATHLDRTYSVLCLGLKPGLAADVRRAAEMIAASMRWRT
jgi:hypothetical protein